jgi:hypothetical protein
MNYIYTYATLPIWIFTIILIVTSIKKKDAVSKSNIPTTFSIQAALMNIAK